MRARLHSVLSLLPLIVIGIPACQSSAPPVPATLDGRIQGWWMVSAMGPCDAACTIKPPNPECGQPDCVERNFLGFKGQTAYDCAVSYSAKAGTMSTILGVTIEGYTLDANASTLRLGTGQVQAVTCNDTTNMTLGYGALTRAPSAFSDAFDVGIGSGTAGWRALPVK